MSMLSAQVDDLRKTADELCKLEGYDRTSIPWAQDKLARMLRQAAGTIWELRDMCVGLMEERDTYRDLVGTMDHPDLNAQLNAENERLRELVRGLWAVVDESYLPPSEFEHVKDLVRRSNELGVEVDS